MYFFPKNTYAIYIQNKVLEILDLQQVFLNVIFLQASSLFTIIVYAHGRRLCSNWVRHDSTTISYP